MASRAVDSLGAVVNELTAYDYGLCGLVANAAELLYWMAEDDGLPKGTRAAMVYLGSNLRDAVGTMERMADFLQGSNPAYREFVREGDCLVRKVD